MKKFVLKEQHNQLIQFILEDLLGCCSFKQFKARNFFPDQKRRFSFFFLKEEVFYPFTLKVLTILEKEKVFYHVNVYSELVVSTLIWNWYTYLNQTAHYPNVMMCKYTTTTLQPYYVYIMQYFDKRLNLFWKPKKASPIYDWKGLLFLTDMHTSQPVFVGRLFCLMLTCFACTNNDTKHMAQHRTHEM